VAGTAIALWVPHRQLWLRVDGQQAQMVGAGDIVGDLMGDFEALAEDMARSSAKHSRTWVVKGSVGEADG
jgi:hypothetical protein